MSRNQLALAALLVLQILLILVFRSPFAGASAVEARPLLPTLEALTPIRIELGGSAEEPITIEKTGDEWNVRGLGGFPADSNKIERLFDDLEHVTVRRPVVSSSRYHEGFGVAESDYEGRVRIWSAGDGDPEIDLIVGNSANQRIVHLRLAGEDEVFEARGLSPYDVHSATTNWVRKELLDVAQSQVVGIRITNGTGTFELAREAGTWKIVAPADSTELALDSLKVDELVREATSLRIADAVGPRDADAHGLAEPAAIAVVRWSPDAADAAAGQSPADTRETTIEIGKQFPDNESKRYIGRSGFDYTGAIWESSIRKILEGDLDDLTAS